MMFCMIRYYLNGLIIMKASFWNLLILLNYFSYKFNCCSWRTTTCWSCQPQTHSHHIKFTSCCIYDTFYVINSVLVLPVQLQIGRIKFFQKPQSLMSDLIYLTTCNNFLLCCHKRNKLAANYIIFPRTGHFLFFLNKSLMWASCLQLFPNH